MMKDRIIFSTFNSKNIERDKIEKILKEVTLAAGGAAAGGVHGAAGIARVAAAIASKDSASEADIQTEVEVN